MMKVGHGTEKKLTVNGSRRNGDEKDKRLVRETIKEDKVKD
jgi:hypothetical protein